MLSAGEFLALAMLVSLAAGLFSGLPVAIVLMAVGFGFGGAGMLIGAVRPTDIGGDLFQGLRVSRGQ